MATILGANTLSTGYTIENSVRFADGDNDAFSRTFGSALGTRTKFTISMWIKRGTMGHSQFLFEGTDGTYPTHTYISSGNKFALYDGGENATYVTTYELFDPNAWYHVVTRIDTTQADNANRVRFYINGVLQSTTQSNSITQSGNISLGKGVAHYIGRRAAGTDSFDGYMAEVVYIESSSLGPDSFGESDDNGVWIPKDVSGLSFPTNSAYLDFKDSSNLGNDAAGGTDWSEDNIVAINQTTDTPSNNFATVNILVPGTTPLTFSKGNLKAAAGGNWGHCVGSIGLNSGKWYWEVDEITANANAFFGICSETAAINMDGDATPYDQNGLILYFVDGRRTVDGTNSEGEYNAWGTTHGFALDLDSGTRTLTFYKDGSSEGSVNLSTTHFPTDEFCFPTYLGSASSNATNVEFNFGNPVTALASGNADANGYGSFEFAPPNGHYAICTKNLAQYG